MQWTRRFSNSSSNFDLILAPLQELDSERLQALLNAILEETHRGITLSARATKEFRRWFDQPETPLKSKAYVLLSNWFMGQLGDRRSNVGSCCEHLWDALFPSRPMERLSSPVSGRNHLMKPHEF